MALPTGFRQAVWTLVGAIPAGRVLTYGGVATLLGHPRHARQVGYALAALTPAQARRIPWQRVINSRGAVSVRGASVRLEGPESRPRRQLALLRGEGVPFDGEGRCRLRDVFWQGPYPSWLEAWVSRGTLPEGHER